MMEDHLSKIPMMASSSPTESSGSSGAEDSRGGESKSSQRDPMGCDMFFCLLYDAC